MQPIAFAALPPMAETPPEKKSKYTADRRIPGAFEGETVTRRRAIGGSVQLFGGLATAAFVLPSLGFAIGPLFKKQPVSWEKVATIADIPDDTYVPRVITLNADIAEVGKSTVYLRKRNPQYDKEPADQYNQVVALSSRCMHLGCPVRFVAASARFICPCHGGVYGFDGKVDGGPPVRPLDHFYTEIRNGDVYVGPRFSVNSELQRFSPRFPGEELDGIGQYLYPSRPTQRKLPGT
jgi:quinol---cytochrome c reductase iron-sulfur subunit, bacillus type